MNSTTRKIFSILALAVTAITLGACAASGLAADQGPPLYESRG